MADEVSAPAIPPLALPAPGAVSVGEPTVVPPVLPPVTPPAPAPRSSPDAVTLTKRELDERILLAVAGQQAEREAQEKKRMADEQATQTASEIAKLQQQLAAQQEQIAAALKAQKETSDKLETAEKARAEAEDQAKKAKSKAKQRVVEATLKAEASQAGIEDADYALVLYARAVTTCMSADPPKPTPDSKQFFASLKATNPGIFKAAPTAVPATTGTGQDGQPPPPPPKAGAGSTLPDEVVDQLDHQKFAERTRNKYGYNPTIG